MSENASFVQELLFCFWPLPLVLTSLPLCFHEFYERNHTMYVVPWSHVHLYPAYAAFSIALNTRSPVATELWPFRPTVLKNLHPCSLQHLPSLPLLQSSRMLLEKPKVVQMTPVYVCVLSLHPVNNPFTCLSQLSLQFVSFSYHLLLFFQCPRHSSLTSFSMGNFAFRYIHTHTQGQKKLKTWNF